MEQLCKHRTQGIRTRKASCLSGGTGEKSGALIRNTMEIRRASKKAGVHRKKQKLLSDTRKTRSSLREDGGIEGNTRKSWRNTRKKGRTKNNAQQSNEFKDYKKLWLKKQQIDEKDVLHSQKTRLLNDFRTEQFGLFCQELLINLNTFLFDENEETNVIRILLRKYNKEKHEHQAYLADGINSAKTENITNFKWKTGLIYRSFIQKAALLQSANLKYYEHGKPDKWRNSLTIAIDGITIKIHNEEVPLLSLNIAIISQDCEKILEALALSSIYQTLEEIFTFYSKRVYDIRQIIYPEDKK